MCSINIGLVGLAVSLLVGVIAFMRFQPTIRYEYQAHSPRDQNVNGANNEQGSWYIGSENSALQKLKDGLHSVKVC